MRPLPLALAAAGLTAGWSLVEPHLPVLRRVAVPMLPAGSPDVRVLHVSDLHLLPGSTRLSRWVRQLARLGADLVVSTGDHLSAPAAVPLLCDTMSALTAGGATGVFVPGNNDYYLPRPPSVVGYVTGREPRRRGPDLPWRDVAAALSAAGWVDLTHVRTTVRLGPHEVTVTGTDDAHLRRDRYALVAGPVATVLGIGVTHTPARRVLSGLSADGHQLLLAGHTHGGQVRLPGLGALVTNCDLDRVRARGLSTYDGSWLHVSAGLGTSPYAPVRLCCRPEATLLTLVASGSVAGA